MTRYCSIAGCPSPHAARGACKDHYNDWYSGKIELPDPTEVRTHYSDPEECFAARTKRVGDHLIWTGPPELRAGQDLGRRSPDRSQTLRLDARARPDPRRAGGPPHL